jgi:hypothetical protein
MAKQRDAFSWGDLWSLYAQLSRDNPQKSYELVVTLNQAGPFGDWLESKAPGVQVDIMTGAPAWLLAQAVPVMSDKAMALLYKKLSERDRDLLGRECPGARFG